MVLPALLFVVGGGLLILYLWFRRRTAPIGMGRAALAVGLPAGVVRASLACLGWYVVEHTGGPAQVPAFVLAMLSWPEAALLPRRAPGMTSASLYVSLFLLLTLSTTAVVAIVAALARRRSP
jgi:hypothetical protein